MKPFLINLLEIKGDLPPLPDVLLKLEDHINDPNSDLDSVSALIQTDPVLQGRLINLANSVLYGGGREKAEDLSTALLRLGLKMVLDLVFTSELPKLFKKVKSFNQLQFWKHSLAVAYVSRTLGKRLLSDREAQEACYLCGLMHDIGVLVFEYLIPEKYSEFLGTADKSRPLQDLETEAFGIAHAELGARFIRKWWKVPPVVVDVVETNHKSVPRPGADLEVREIVFLANAMAVEGGLADGLTEYQEPMPEDQLETLGLDRAERESIMEVAHQGLASAESMLMG